jgi:hypothetical protein
VTLVAEHGDIEIRRAGTIQAASGTRATDDSHEPPEQLSSDQIANQEQFISDLRKKFKQDYYDATIAGSGNDELVVVSERLDLESERGRVMRAYFGPAVRKRMCEAGFKTIALQSGMVFREGERYSLSCSIPNPPKPPRPPHAPHLRVPRNTPEPQTSEQ